MGNPIKYIRQSLPTKISLVMFFYTVVVFALIDSFSMVMSRRHFHAISMKNASEALSSVVARAERYIQSVETTTDVTSLLLEENFCPDSLLAYSRKVVEGNAFVSGCSISARPDMFPEFGRYYSAYTVRKSNKLITTIEDEYEYFDYDWYRKAAMSGKSVWVEPFEDNNGGSLSADHMIASYCRPLYDKEHKLLGVISTDISMPEFSRALSSVKPYPHAYLILLGKDGRYYTHPDSTKITNHTIFEPADGHYSPQKLSLGYEMTARRSGRMHAEVGGVVCLICYQPVPGTSASAALVIPESDVLHGYRHFNMRMLVLIFLVLAIIYLICRRTVARAFAPVKLLEEQSQRIANGDYSTVIAHSTTNSVTGRLQNSFADMQEILNSHIQELNAAIAGSEKRNEELLKANSVLEDAIRRQSEFVANMTHQIRTPLNLIMGFAQLLRENGKNMSAEEKQALLHVIDYHTMILCRMSLMLYDSSDRGYRDEMVSFNYDYVSCNAVAKECIGDVNRYFPNVTVKFETAIEDSFAIFTDHLYLMRSIREILYNSAKYSDGKNISIRIETSKTAVRYIFEDTGTGIPPKYQEHLFTPFYKYDNLSEGLGVGLPLTKRHVILLGGTLELDPDYTKGCRFIMTFPIESPMNH